MFDIGFAELFLLLIIALLVLGPEKLPSAVRKVGLMIGKVKGSWQHIQQEIDIELKAEELRKKIDNETSSAQNALNSAFDADAHNAMILDQERRIKEEMAREQKELADKLAIEQQQTASSSDTSSTEDTSSSRSSQNS
jgi:sec-independent protein translocase protein TatB